MLSKASAMDKGWLGYAATALLNIYPTLPVLLACLEQHEVARLRYYAYLGSILFLAYCYVSRDKRWVSCPVRN